MLYRCLASDYARRLGIDDWTMQLAWSKIVAANPGLHVAGYAQVPSAHRVSADTAEVTVAVEGHSMQVRLRRTSQWRVRYERQPLPPEQPGGLPRQPSPGEVSHGIAAPGPLLVVQQADDEVERSRISLSAVGIEHIGVDSLTNAQIDFFGIERLWKVIDVTVRD